MDAKTPSAHAQLHHPLLLRATYRAVLCVCLLLLICASLIQEHVGNGFRLTSGAAKPNFAAISRLPGEEEKVITRSSTLGAFTSALRRLLLGGLQHYMVIGLLNEDGTLSSEFIGSRKFVDRDTWEGGIQAGEGFQEAVGGERHHKAAEEAAKAVQFEMCPSKMTNFIPCLDDMAAIKQLPDAARGEQWERHCPSRASRVCCIIAAPAKYKVPIGWPRSKAEVWAANVPRPRRGWNESWIAIQKDKLSFPTTHNPFPTGMDGYVEQLAQMVPDLKFGSRTRTALEVGCGVGSFGAALLGRGVLPLSIAAKGSRTNEVQLALERGIPAMVAAFATQRLPFPSQAFDLIHCFDCEVEWTRDGGMILTEGDRLLRAGGYFVWAPPHGKKSEATWHQIEDLARNLCWTLVVKGHLAIWQKPSENHCYEDRAPGAWPPLCEESDDPNAVWYVPLKQCITRLPANSMTAKLPDWPGRLSLLPKRMAGGSLMYTEAARLEVFVAQQRHWNEIVSGYLRGLGLKKEHVRNVMDMRAGFGGFAAALVDQRVDWWVMNVVPPHSPNSLPVIYDRGLLGVVHDWCEPFDTYPRTYDLLHAVGLFSAEESRCNIAHIILEMDRILRPGGWVLIRESKAMATKVEALAKSVHWKTRILETESGPYGKDKLLSCIKRRK